MNMRIVTNLAVGLLWVAVLLVTPASLPADQAQYVYDELGRLVLVVSEKGELSRGLP